MPTVTIKPGEHLSIRYPVPRGRLIEYEVEAERPVTTYILDEEGLHQYLGESDAETVTSYYGGFHRRHNHRQELRLPFTGWWYLVIQNLDRKEPVAVHYEVSG
jgi:hypothetical protein